MKVTLEWNQPSINAVKQNMDNYGNKVTAMLVSIGEQFAPQIESRGKNDAPWTDRTANARRGLRSFVVTGPDGRVYIYFTHQVDYGIFLELRWQGRYSIIMRTLESFYNPVWSAVKNALR